jgi:hypothetical protein
MSLNGIFVCQESGHRYIESAECGDLSSFEESLESKNIYMRSKVYGGFLDAVERVNKAFKLSRGIDLIEYFDETFTKGDYYSESDLECSCENNLNEVYIIKE